MTHNRPTRNVDSAIDNGMRFVLSRDERDLGNNGGRYFCYRARLLKELGLDVNSIHSIDVESEIKAKFIKRNDECWNITSKSEFKKAHPLANVPRVHPVSQMNEDWLKLTHEQKAVFVKYREN